MLLLLVLSSSVNNFPTAPTQSQNSWRQIRTTDNSVAESPRGMLFHINNSNTQDIEGRQWGGGGVDLASCLIVRLIARNITGYYVLLTNLSRSRWLDIGQVYMASLRETSGSPERARWLHLARSGSQSQRAIWFILPTRGASHIINIDKTRVLYVYSKQLPNLMKGVTQILLCIPSTVSCKKT